MNKLIGVEEVAELTGVRESAIRRIGAMARVHTLLYKSPDLASIDFKDYREDLLHETAEGFGADVRGIRTDLEAEPMR